MATINWPTGRAWTPQSVTFGGNTSKSGFRGFYTGGRQTVSHLSDRYTISTTLGPCLAADAGLRSALLMALDSTGDYVSFSPFHRRYPTGTFSGSPLVNGAVTAAARTVAIDNVLARPNLLFGSGFELDVNADHIGDGWISWSNGSTGSVTASMPTGNNSAKGQRIDGGALGATSVDQIGIRYNAFVPASVGTTYTLSADTRDSGGTIRLVVEWFTAAPALVSTTTQTFATTGATYTRRSISGTCPATATQARIYIWLEGATGGPVASGIEVDNVQFEVGSTASTYAGLATLLGGDFIAAGGNLLMVGYAGATANDAGAMSSVPLVLPAQVAISDNAAVTWSAPTGLWQLDSDGLLMDYSPASVQQGITLQFRQVIA